MSDFGNHETQSSAAATRVRVQETYGAEYYESEYYATHLGPLAYIRNEHRWVDFFGRIADEIVRSLQPKSVLDVGCAIGFLVEALWQRGVRAYGIDISEYAIGQVPRNLQEFCRVASVTGPLPAEFPERFDLITCIEVLEHIPKDDAPDAVKNMASRTGCILFSSTPEDIEEPTHLNVRPVLYWLQLFAELGFYPDVRFDATFVSPQAYLLRRAEPRLREDILPSFAGFVDLRLQVVALENKVASLSARLDELQRSFSWRMTRPLRVLRAWQTSLIKGRRTHRCTLISGPSVERLEEPGLWRSRDGNPWFLLDEPVQGGWLELAYRMSCRGVPRGSVCIDTGSGFSEAQRVSLPGPVRGEVRTVLSLPDHVYRLRIDPLGRPGRFQFDDFNLRPLGALQVALRGLTLAARELLRNPDLLAKAYERLRKGGLQEIMNYAVARGVHFNRDTDEYASWVVESDVITEADRGAIREHIETLPRKPRISVIMPVYQTKERYLRAAIESVRRQLYPNWELCIADDASSDPRVRRVLDEYKNLDPRIKVVLRPVRGQISAASNSALELATGDFIALLDHDDEIPEHAFYMVTVEINDHPDAVLIYSDEDKIDPDGRRSDPYFKSDWNPDLFYGHNMISHLGVYRTDVVREIGGFRSEYDGSQDYDLALRVIERITPEQIRHVPHVLYHWRRVEGSAALRGQEKPYAHEAARKALQSHFDRKGKRARSVAAPGNPYSHRALFALPSEAPLITVIIPTRNGKALLERAVAGVRRARYDRIELIIVNNQSDDRETLAYLKELESAGVCVLAYEKPFNWSAINNFAAASARGEVLLFLNNDVEPLDDEWLEELVRHAVRPEVGAVGAALYYPDRHLQHGGVILGFGGVSGHAHHGLPMGHGGYRGRAMLAQDLSAVTGACMATRRGVFFEVGGLDEEHLSVVFNDIDYCLRIRERGYLVVWTPYSRLYHLEAATRGPDDAPGAAPRVAQEYAYMRRRWGHLLSADPYYNPNLALSRLDFSLAWPPRTTKPWKTCKSDGSWNNRFRRLLMRFEKRVENYLG